MIVTPYTQDTAVFSPDRKYRYLLVRLTGVPNQRVCVFIMLNPSTADELTNDPTVTRCINFARQWEFGVLIVVNIFAYRATKPTDMKQPWVEPIGPENDQYILQASAAAALRVCAWGTHGAFGGRGAAVRQLLANAGLTVSHLGLTGGGHPKHPLYLPAITEPITWVK